MLFVLLASLLLACTDSEVQLTWKLFDAVRTESRLATLGSSAVGSIDGELRPQ